MRTKRIDREKTEFTGLESLEAWARQFAATQFGNWFEEVGCAFLLEERRMRGYDAWMICRLKRQGFQL